MRPKLTKSARYKCLEFLKKNSYELYLSYCGVEDCDPSHSYGPISRTEFLLHYVIKGKGVFNADGKSYHLSEHDAFLIYPDETTYYQADETEPWSYIWVGFNGIKAENALTNASFSKENRVNQFYNKENLIAIVNKMLNASKLTYANDLKREGYLYLFLSALVQEKYDIKSKEADIYDYPYQIYVDHALEFIKHNYEKNIKVNDIAQYIGINRSYLTTIFKKTINTSPQEYLVKYRLEKACSLLKTTDLPIGVIASRVGYDNPLTFSKVFKNFYEVSPTVFRTQQQEPIYSNKKE
ncbi:AraC family transcriptional regulator of arabinose operon [Natronobacillus azotifigens]|uniref:AraC family transcriptional regulator n=1 Tax=Natronobacillus azotifigens TaxID=472978 RepID=A0A9J6R9I9_9BACI|nr:AraC family transcriptional regulator [Natronobacillus azotifigens]MCZ0702269.1 AraC family transcriptional regulator [Natronobacillus azotifigens]